MPENSPQISEGIPTLGLQRHSPVTRPRLSESREHTPHHHPEPSKARGNTTVTMTSLEMVAFINSQRKEGEVELRHDNFMAKVPKVLGDDAPKFLGTQTSLPRFQKFLGGGSRKIFRHLPPPTKRADLSLLPIPQA